MPLELKKKIVRMKRSSTVAKVKGQPKRKRLVADPDNVLARLEAKEDNLDDEAEGNIFLRLKLNVSINFSVLFQMKAKKAMMKIRILIMKRWIWMKKKLKLTKRWTKEQIMLRTSLIMERPMETKIMFLMTMNLFSINTCYAKRSPTTVKKKFENSAITVCCFCYDINTN